MLFPRIALLLTTALANPIYDISVYDEVRNGENDGYRLPSTQTPLNYKLDIIVGEDIFQNKANTFEGKIKITFRVTEKLDTVKLHAPMKINSVDLKSSKNTVKIEDYSNLNETTSILSIKLSAELDDQTDYILTISYTGNIDMKSMVGFYKSTYLNEQNDKESILATQFEPVYARHAFPCFDEPKLKATFDLAITYPKGYTALSNTPQNGAAEDIGTDQEKVTFKQTPKMSTYLIAFTVSKLTCSDGEKIDTNVPVRVCSRTESNNERKLALEYGSKLLKAFEEFTAIQFNKGVTKMDQIAIPDFSAGAMENWGLVTYRERLLLYSEEESSNSYKQSIISTIAHELAHQWFGDLVTCNWWDDLFLNEGFAAYFQYFILTQLKDLTAWEFEKQFNVNELQAVLVDDGVLSSQALTAKVASQAEINAKFGRISYNKGASVIRMMENIMGTDNFKKGLQNYLNQKAMSSAVPSDLLSALEDQAKSNLPSGFTLSQVMDNWLNLGGYPVVTVTQRGRGLSIKQQRFLYDESDSKSKWNIPISYTVQTDKNKFDSVAPKAWLTSSQSLITDVFDKNGPNSWVVLNNQQSAYYRVQYTTTLWQRIAEQLLKDHTQIHVLNRAQIADDLFNFARANEHMKYSQAFQYLEYLSKETEYYPWVSALASLNFLLIRVGEDTSLGASLKLKVLELLDGVYKTVSYDDDDSNLQVKSLKKNLVLNAACVYGSDECISNSVSLFKKYRDTGKIHKNLKKLVYCHGLKYSKDQENDWEFLWDKYGSTKLSTEQITILEALGCTKNSNLLKKYLDLSVNETSGIRIQDFAVVWNSVYSNTPQGVQVALEYLLENHEKIMQYTSTAPSLLNGVVSQFISQPQIDKIKEFISMDNVDELYKTAGNAAIQSATKNLAWLDSMRQDLLDYLPVAPTEAPPGGSASSITAMSSFVLILITIIKFKLVQ